MTADFRLPVWLEDLEKSLATIGRFVAGVDEAAFQKDELRQAGVVRMLEVAGEVVKRIDRRYPDFLALHPEIPWRPMMAMRDRMIHEYDRVDLAIVWSTVTDAVPELAARLPDLHQDAVRYGAAQGLSRE